MKIEISESEIPVMFDKIKQREKMITVDEKIKVIDALVFAFNPDGQPIGVISNVEQLMDLQCQIAEEQAEGYYVKYMGNTININSKGELSEHPAGFFDKQRELLFKLHKIRANIINKK